MIIVNPEFHRYLWLNFSPIRLIVPPIVLGLLFYVLAAQPDEFPWQARLFKPALFIYFVVMFLWGSYEAASAAVSDLGKKTWDFLKMSSLAPWSLTIGKLFGATSYVWYIGLILLAVIGLSYGAALDTVKFQYIREVAPTPVNLLIYLLLATISGHTAALFMGTHGLQLKKQGIAASFIGGFLVSGFVFSITVGFNLQSLVKEPSEIFWHTLSVNQDVFLIGSILFLLFWMMVASQRTFREELQYKNAPIVLVLFLATFSFYISGYLDNNRYYATLDAELKLVSKIYLSFLIILFFTYLATFKDATDLARYKRWIYAWKAREWRHFFENTPGWAGCVLLLVPAYIFLILHAGVVDVPARIWQPIFSFSNLAFISALSLFVLRDGLVYHAVLLGKIERHKMFWIFLYLFSAYILLPFLASLGGEAHIAAFFYPIGDMSFVSACLPVFMQCFLAAIGLGYIVKSLRA
ncbi:MAG: hypothetical protein KDJ75_07925 [Alphaproteobacteria bacterium]|nr:hypothetical protein [Alphaproteobacteria bacterium]